MIPFLRRFQPGTPPIPAPTSPDTLSIAADRIAAADSVDDLVAAIIATVRPAIGSDGITLVHREGDEVAYLSEDAISPLWAGQRFPIRMCLSGQAMLTRSTIIIPDIEQDRRVPLNAYVATFVRSMAVVPFGGHNPDWTIGAYWRDVGPVSPVAVVRLTTLANAATHALARIEQAAISERQPA